MRLFRIFRSASARHMCLMLTALALAVPVAAAPVDGAIEQQGMLAEPVTALPSTASSPDAPLPGDTSAAAEPIAKVKKRAQASERKSVKKRSDARGGKRNRAMAKKASARSGKAGKTSASRKGGKRR